MITAVKTMVPTGYEPATWPGKEAGPAHASIVQTITADDQTIIDNGLARSPTYTDLLRRSMHAAYVIDDVRRDGFIIAIGERFPDHFTRWATLKVLRSGAVAKLVTDDSVLTSHRDAISQEYNGIGDTFGTKHKNDMNFQTMKTALLMGGTDCKTVLSQSNAVFGSGIVVPVEELRYSILSRGNVEGGAGDLFELFVLQDDSSFISIYGKPGDKFVHPSKYPPIECGVKPIQECGGFFVALTTRRAKRLCVLMNRYKK